MKILVVVFESGKQGRFQCDSAESTSEFLRLYGPPGPNPEEPPVLYAQFRLRGPGSITGWFADTALIEEENPALHMVGAIPEEEK